MQVMLSRVLRGLLLALLLLSCAGAGLCAMSGLVLWWDDADFAGIVLLVSVATFSVCAVGIWVIRRAWPEPSSRNRRW